jgi:RNA polymerase sigma factor (sigma-70 family)
MTIRPPTSDSQLLSDFTAGSRDALCELVLRHLDAVYSAACRQVGDRHLAEDVTQAVFLLLSQKAGSLAGGTILGAWLHRATRYCAANALRMQANRRRHERMAAEMATHRTGGNQESIDWPAISAALDDAVNRLPALERQVIVLRFLEGKSHADVGTELGLSPDAAAKRMQRALLKLRQRLARGGNVTTVAGLSAALTANATQAAPAQLASSVVAGMASPAAASLTLLSIARRAMQMMFWTQLKSAAVSVASVLIVVAAAAAVVIATTRGDWGVNGAATMNTEAATQSPSPAASRPNPASQPDLNPPWRAPFDAIYTLGPTEAVRRIPPPFIEARKGFLHDKYAVDTSKINGVIGSRAAGYTTDPPQALYLDFDGKTGRVERWVRSNQRPWTLESLISNLVGLSPEQFILPPKMDIQISGDWVIRRGATVEARLQGFQKAVRPTRAAFEVQKQIIQRQVIVARGTFNKSDWPGGVISVSLARDKGSRRSAGDVKFYFRQLTKMFGRPVVNEWKGSEEARMEFANNSSQLLPGLDQPSGDQKLSDVLKELGQQLHIELTAETRPIDTWVFSPAEEK